MTREHYDLVELGEPLDVPLKAGRVEGARLTYLRGAARLDVDIFNDDCQYTPSGRCYSLRSSLSFGQSVEGLPFNRRRWGHPHRQQWRQRVDHFLHDLKGQLDLGQRADADGYFHGRVAEVNGGYGFIQAPGLERIFFHSSRLSIPWRDVKLSLSVRFTLGENARGREAVDVRPYHGRQNDVLIGPLDHSTARKPREVRRLLPPPAYADAEGRILGRIVRCEGGRGFAFAETLMGEVFVHRSSLPQAGVFGPQLLRRGVLMKLGETTEGLQCVDGLLLPAGRNLTEPFEQEWQRATLDTENIQHLRRFRLARHDALETMNERRPTITAAALRDIVTGQPLLFIHTRWQTLQPLSQPHWVTLTERVIEGYFLGEAPPLVYLSTTDTLYQVTDLTSSPPAWHEVKDSLLKTQLEKAAPHPDD